jgi:hypothetical protein
MDALWTRVTASIREIQDSFPEKNRSAYTTIQTTVYRLEEKKALRRVQKIGNFQTCGSSVPGTISALLATLYWYSSSTCYVSTYYCAVCVTESLLFGS